MGSGARGRVRVGARARARGKGRVRGRVRVRVLLPQALRRARRGGRHCLGVDALDLGDIGERYGRFTGDVGEIHRLGVDALDLLRAVGVDRQAVLTW